MTGRLRSRNPALEVVFCAAVAEARIHLNLLDVFQHLHICLHSFTLLENNANSGNRLQAYALHSKSSEACTPEVLRPRMERCVEMRLRYPDDLSAIDMHELHCLCSDGKLRQRFWKEFPTEGCEMTIKLLCHERAWTREQAEQHLAGCEKTIASWKNNPRGVG